jgi:hypothetical protein
MHLASSLLKKAHVITPTPPPYFRDSRAISQSDCYDPRGRYRWNRRWTPYNERDSRDLEWAPNYSMLRTRGKEFGTGLGLEIGK